MKKIALSNINKPAPRWFRIINRVWSPTENTILLLLLAFGYAEQSLYMIVFKIGSGFVRSLLDMILAELKEEN